MYRLTSALRKYKAYLETEISMIKHIIKRLNYIFTQKSKNHLG